MTVTQRGTLVLPRKIQPKAENVFSETFTPNDLKPKEFVEFVLSVMKEYYVDLSQPTPWGSVCSEDGAPIKRDIVLREISSRLIKWDCYLTPTLGSKIIETFRIYGQAVNEQNNYRNYQIKKLEILICELRDMESQLVVDDTAKFYHQQSLIWEHQKLIKKVKNKIHPHLSES